MDFTRIRPPVKTRSRFDLPENNQLLIRPSKKNPDPDPEKIYLLPFSFDIHIKVNIIDTINNTVSKKSFI